MGPINDALRTPDRINQFIAGLIFSLTALVYWQTVAPTFSFWDCGEFVASAYTLGVAHPPGSPLYVTIARLFSILPIGMDIGWRVNLLSVFSSSLAAMFGYLIVQRIISTWFLGPQARDRINRIISYLAGAIGALVLAFGRTAWSNAVEAEVYGLTMALFLAVLYLITLAIDNRQARRRAAFLLGATYLTALGLGVHMTVFLMAPTLVLALALPQKLDSKGWLIILLSLTGLLYLIFALSSRADEIAFYVPMAFLAVIMFFHTLSIKKTPKLLYITGAFVLVSLYPLLLKIFSAVTGVTSENGMFAMLEELTFGQIAVAGLIVWGIRQFYLWRTQDDGAPAPGRTASIVYCGAALLLLVISYFVRGHTAFLVLASIGGAAFVFYFRDKLNWLTLAAGVGIALAIIGFWEFVFGSMSMLVVVSVIDLFRDERAGKAQRITALGIALAVFSSALWFGPELLKSHPALLTSALGTLALMFILFRMRAGLPDWRVASAALVLAVLGFSSNLFVPIRSAQSPLINENNPSQSIASFVGYFERKQYGRTSMVERMFERRAEWTNQFGVSRRMGFWGFFRNQFGFHGVWFVIPLVFGVYGLWETIRRSPGLGAVFSIALALSSVGLVLYMNFADGTRMIGARDYMEVRDRDYFFTPAFMLFSLAIGLGFAGALQTAREAFGSMKFAPLLAGGALAAFALPAVALAENYRTNNRSANFIAYDYGHNLLVSAAPNAILITAGDNDTFPLWALQSVYGLRRDVAVLNLSLANTNWYLKQMRDNWGLPLYMSDEQIDALRTRRMPDGRIVRIQEQIVDILLATRKTHQRPVQFAITVPSSRRTFHGKPLDSSLTLVGRVYELRDDSDGPRIDIRRTDSLHFNEFKFRSLGADPVPQTAHSRGITNAYASVFVRMADTLEKAGDIDGALRQLYKSVEILPAYRPVHQRIIRILSDAGRSAELLALFSGEWAKERSLLRYWVQHARRSDRTDESIAALRVGITNFVGDRQMLFGLLALELETKQYDSLRMRLTDWLAEHPEDTSARTLLDKLSNKDTAQDSE